MNPATAVKLISLARNEDKRHVLMITVGLGFAILVGGLLLFMAMIASLSGMINISTGFKSGAESNIAKAEIPPELMPIYVNAQEKYDVSWAVLAAINKVETNFGRNLATSSAGAIGWMQFMPSTWEKYKEDGNGDGVCDPYNPWDAIFAAAKYLKACGFEKDPSRAIYAYNHANWYVNEVLSIATSYSTDMVPTGKGVWPVPGYIQKSSEFGYRYDPFTGERKYHEGIDIPAPQGTPVVAAVAGRITVAHYVSGYGLCIEIQSDNCMVLYGHLSGFNVHEGQIVQPGQTIGYVGNTGRSKGAHLHFGVYVNNSPCNPMEWLEIPSGNY